MRYAILGPLEVERDGMLLEVAGPKVRLLLALLLLRRNEPVSIDALAEALWGEEAQPNAPSTVQVYVSRLRRALGSGEGPILTRRPGYLIRVEPGQLDSDLFESLAGEASAAMAAGAPAIASAKLRRALGLWRGDPLADFAFEPFAEVEIQRLEEMRLTATEDLFDAELASGRHEEVVGAIAAEMARHPFRERLRGHLMLALYRAGRQSEALEVYRETAAVLDREMGIEPSPSLKELHVQILNHDPAITIESRREIVVHHDTERLPLIGRAEELLALDDATRLAERGHAVVVDLEGAAGSGKTRLLEELELRLDPERFDLRRTAAYKATGSAPGALLDHLGVGIDGALPASTRTPVVVVDDAQWGDPASLLGMRDLLVAREGGVLLVVAHRPVSGFADVSFQALWQVASAEGPLLQLGVSALTPTDLARALDADDPEGLAARILATTGGLAFHVAELMTFWIESGGLVRDRDRLTTIGPLREWAGPPYAPASLDALDPEARDLLEAVSLASRPVTIDEGAEILDLPPDDVARTVGSLSELRLVAETPQGVAPVHDLAAVAIAGAMSRDRRVSTYGRLADAALTRSDEVRAGWYLLDAGMHERAAALLEEGAARCMEEGASGEAIPLLEGAILARSRISGDPAAIARLRAQRAQAEMEQSSLVSRAMADLEAALPYLSADDRVNAALPMAWTATDSLRGTQAETIFATGIADALRVGRYAAAGVLAAWYGPLLAMLGFVGEADALCEKAEGLLLDHGTDQDRFHVPLARAQVAFIRGDAGRAEAWYRQAVGGLPSPDGDWYLSSAPWWITTLYWCGRVTEARREEEVVRRAARTSYNVITGVLLDEVESHALSALGRSDEALDPALRVLDRLPRVTPEGEPRGRHAVAVALFGLGRVEEAFDEVRNALDLLPQGSDGWYFRTAFAGTELALRARIEGTWPAAEAAILTDELLASRRLQLAGDLLCERAGWEGRPDLARHAAQIALDASVPMLAARAAHAGSLWDEPLGVLVGARVREMRWRVPPAWRADWEALPQIERALGV